MMARVRPSSYISRMHAARVYLVLVIVLLTGFLGPHVQVQAKQDIQRSSFIVGPRSLQQLNPKPQSSGTSRSPQFPLPPPQQPVTTVLLHKTSLIDPGVRVSFYTYKGNSSYSKELLPVLFLLNGADVEATHYSQVASLLAARGYTFIASDYHRKVPDFLPQPFRNRRCPEKGPLLTSAALIRTWLDYVEGKGAKDDPVLKELPQRGLVLLAHSFGGVAATNIIMGACGELLTCERYVPPLATATSTTTTTTSSSKAATCQAIRLPLDSEAAGSVSEERGPSKSVLSLSSQRLIRGGIAWEGYAGSLSLSGPTAKGITVPPGMFFMYLGGQYNNNTGSAYEQTKANGSTCSCTAFAKFPGMNHYGVTNWQPEGSHQVTPCAAPVAADPKNFTVSKERQEQGLKDQAQLADLIIRSVGLREVRAQKELGELQQQGGVPGPAGYALSLKGACV